MTDNTAIVANELKQSLKIESKPIYNIGGVQGFRCKIL